MIDSHCHLDHEPLFNDLDNVIKRSKAAGVKKLLTICTTFKSFENSGYDSFSNFIGGEFITGEGGVSPLFPFYDMGRNSGTVKENIEKSEYGSFFMPF